MNYIDVVAVAALVIWAVCAVGWCVKRKKNGKCIGCDGDCSHCTESVKKGDDNGNSRG